MVDKWHGPSDCIISPPKSNNDKHIKPNKNYKTFLQFLQIDTQIKSNPVLTKPSSLQGDLFKKIKSKPTIPKTHIIAPSFGSLCWRPTGMDPALVKPRIMVGRVYEGMIERDVVSWSSTWLMGIAKGKG